MERRRLFLFALVVCVSLGAGFLFVHTHDRQPRYQDHSLAYWLRLYARGTGPEAPEAQAAQATKAVAAVRAIGADALPCLLQWIRYEPPSWRETAFETVDRLPGRLTENPVVDSVLTDPASKRAASAALAFSILGPQASPAIPELTLIMNDPGVPNASRTATEALAYIGRDAFPFLVAVLTNREAACRVTAADCIGSMRRAGADATPAVPVLVQCLQDKDLGLAEAAARSLGRLSLRPDIAVPALAQALSDPRLMLRRAVVRALRQFGDESLPAVPALIHCLGDADPLLASDVAGALGRLRLESKVVVPALANSLQSPLSAVRHAAVQALGAYGHDAREAIPVLLPLLESPDLALRSEAANALHRIAPETLAKTAAP
jgi:HEAT repeat protein